MNRAGWDVWNQDQRGYPTRNAAMATVLGRVGTLDRQHDLDWRAME